MLQYDVGQYSDYSPLTIQVASVEQNLHAEMATVVITFEPDAFNAKLCQDSVTDFVKHLILK
jgi:hypothetical protein